MLFNAEFPKEQCMESQIAASFAAELSIASDTDFSVYGETYYYKNIPGVNGLLDGEMNVRIYKKMSEDISCFNSTGAAISARIECNLRISIVAGYNLCGDIFIYTGGGCEQVGTCTNVVVGSVGLPLKVYLETDQKKFHNETAVTKNDLGRFDFESTYALMGEYVTFNNYRKSIVPYTCVGGEVGGGLLTGECAYLTSSNNWSTTLNQNVRLASRRGGHANATLCSGRTVHANNSASYTARIAAGFAQVLIRDAQQGTTA